MKIFLINQHILSFMTLIFVYLFLCIVLFLAQRALMYFPSQMPDVSQTVWKKIQVDKNVLAIETLDSNKDTFVIFHGNAGNASMRFYYSRIILPKYHIVVAEYPGFGLNHNKEISKQAIVNSARALMTKLKNENKGELILLGESLGSGVASQMAKEFEINKIVLVTPYSSIADVAQGKFWFLPARLLLKDDFDNVESLKDYKGKVLSIIAEDDSLIPPKYAYKLHESISAKKEKIVVKNAGHNNWLDKITRTQLMQLSEFLE